MMDPATMQMLFLQQHQQRLLGAAGPRMMSADAQRLLTAAAVSSAHTTSTSPMPKESGSDAAARSWASSHMMPGNHSNHQSSRAGKQTNVVQADPVLLLFIPVNHAFFLEMIV